MSLSHQISFIIICTRGLGKVGDFGNYTKDLTEPVIFDRHKKVFVLPVYTCKSGRYLSSLMFGVWFPTESNQPTSMYMGEGHVLEHR